MQTIELTDEQWQKILRFLRSCSNLYIEQEHECRRFLSAVLWRTHSRAQWRHLPDSYGNWNSVYKRFARWNKQGVFEQLRLFCKDEPELQHLIFDGAVIRTHPNINGAQKEVMPDRHTNAATSC